MTPTRFRECLDLLRWTQRGLAGVLNRDEGWVRMMARGTRPIPEPLAEWLEEVATFHAAHPPPVLEDGRRRAGVMEAVFPEMERVRAIGEAAMAPVRLSGTAATFDMVMGHRKA